MIIEVKCAWCGRRLGTKKSECPEYSDLKVSHGICDECYETVMADLEDYSKQTSQNTKK